MNRNAIRVVLILATAFAASDCIDAQDAPIDARLDNERIDLRCERGPISRTISVLRTYPRLDIVLDDDVPADTQLTYDLKDVSLRTLLESICILGHGLTYTVKGDSIRIIRMHGGPTDVAPIRRIQAQKKRMPRGKDRGIETALDEKRSEMRFTEFPIGKAIACLQMASGLSILMTPEIDRATPITIALPAPSVRDVLDAICQQHKSLTYLVSNEIVWITTKYQDATDPLRKHDAKPGKEIADHE